MELRAAERKRRRDDLRVSRRELVAMRAEEVAQREREAVAQRRHEQAVVLLQQQQQRARAEGARAQAEERRKLSQLHRKRATLWYYGLKPWILLVRVARLNAQRAAAHHSGALLGRAVRRWRGVVALRHRLRRKRETAMGNAAGHFRRRSLLRLGWRVVSDRHNRLQARAMAVRSARRHSEAQRGMARWLAALRRRQRHVARAGRWHSARALGRAWAAWLELVAEGRKRRQADAAKNQIWSRVRTWLTETEDGDGDADDSFA